MADEKQKAVASQGAPATKAAARRKRSPSDEERRMQDALEDDDVLEALKGLHAGKASGG